MFAFLHNQEGAIPERAVHILAMSLCIFAFWVLGTYLLSAYTIFEFIPPSLILFLFSSLVNIDYEAHPYLFLHHISAVFSGYLVYTASMPIICIALSCSWTLCYTSIWIATTNFEFDDGNDDLLTPHNKVYKQPYDEFIEHQPPQNIHPRIFMEIITNI